MAKIRIHELARELNMTNKALLEALRNMDISVKSHMSSLDDAEIAGIKSRLFGKPEKEIVETRVKSTVIRRRKKPIKKEPVKEIAPSEPDMLTKKVGIVEPLSEDAFKNEKLLISKNKNVTKKKRPYQK
jgi:translation initiation factor IF-2